MCVLDCFGRYNKIQQNGWLINNRKLLLTDLEAGSLGLLPGASHYRKDKGALWGVSLIRTIIPMMMPLTSKPNHILNASLPAAFTWGNKIFNIWILGGHRQSDLSSVLFYLVMWWRVTKVFLLRSSWGFLIHPWNSFHFLHCLLLCQKVYHCKSCCFHPHHCIHWQQQYFSLSLKRDSMFFSYTI